MPLPYPPFTPAELTLRRSVWNALGGLFLDTDTRPSLPLIARTLAESSLDEATLDEIWREEVTPALSFNLTLVAGEWGYFDLDWLEEQIVRRRAVRHRLGRWSLSKLFSRAWGNEITPSYAAAMTLRGWLLSLPESECSERAAVWHWLARAYFWPEWTPVADGPGGRLKLIAAWTELEPVLRPLLVAGENAEQHRAAMLKLIA